MSILTVEQFKGMVDIQGTSDTMDDTAVQLALDAATESLQLGYGRTFVRETATAKYFKARAAGYLDVVDLISVDEIAIDIDSNLSYSKLLTAGQYQLEPFNQTAYQRITIAPLSTQSFWPGYQVRVTGDWGYVDAMDQAPASVQQACLLLANRFLRRKDAPFGVLAFPEMGTAVRLAREDPDVARLMANFDVTEGSWVIL